MGSFNVACSVSKLSISCGTDVAFIPLKATENYNHMGHNAPIPNTAMFVGNESLYEPAMLPLFGKYNDYGSVDNIIEDNNTIALEKKYGLSASQIIELITDGRSALESFSSVFPIFNIKKFNYTDFITEEILLENGFVKVENDMLHHIDSDIYLTISDNKDRKEYKDLLISSETIEKNYSRIDGMDELQIIIFKDFNYILSLSKEDQKYIEVIKYFKGLSGMFVHRDIYNSFVSRTIDGLNKIPDRNNLSSTPSPFLFLKIGFNAFKSEDPYDFDPQFEKDGIIFKIDQFKKSVTSDDNSFSTMKKVFDYLKKNGISTDKDLIKGFNVSKENLIYDISYIDSLVYNGDEKERNVVLKMVRRDHIRALSDKISMNRYWKPFIKTYLTSIEEGDVSFVEDLIDFKSFCYTLYSSNSLFMPPCNGEQFGNDAVSRLLFRKSLLLLDNPAKKDYGNIIEFYLENNDIDKTTEFLKELIQDYIPESISSTTGLSGFEIETFKKNNSSLEEILSFYI